MRGLLTWRGAQADCGDELGETLVEERKIRIAETPRVDGETGGAGGERVALSTFATESTIIADDDLRPSALVRVRWRACAPLTPPAQATMSASPDLVRQQRLREAAGDIAAQASRDADDAPR